MMEHVLLHLRKNILLFKLKALNHELANFLARVLSQWDLLTYCVCCVLWPR